MPGAPLVSGIDLRTWCWASSLPATAQLLDPRLRDSSRRSDRRVSDPGLAGATETSGNAAHALPLLISAWGRQPRTHGSLPFGLEPLTPGHEAAADWTCASGHDLDRQSRPRPGTRVLPTKTERAPLGSLALQTSCASHLG